ncbi:hypothetical protein NXW59_00010 [Bacteroides fragilis]|nr:hypothetical protein [Bacteroides fragilis]
MRNRGFELELKSIIQNKRPSLDYFFEHRTHKNKPTKLDGEQQGNYQWSFYPSCRSTILSQSMRMSMQVVDPQTGKEPYYINGEMAVVKQQQILLPLIKQSLVLSNLKYKAD